MRRADGIRKVGCALDVFDRRQQLDFQTRVGHEFERAWSMPEAKARMAERLIHLKLKPLRCSGRGSTEVYKLPLKKIKEVVEWSMPLATTVCARGAPKELTDEEVIGIANESDREAALIEMATRGAIKWRGLLQGALVRADEASRRNEVANREVHQVQPEPYRYIPPQESDYAFMGAEFAREYVRISNIRAAQMDLVEAEEARIGRQMSRVEITAFLGEGAV